MIIRAQKKLEGAAVLCRNRMSGALALPQNSGVAALDAAAFGGPVDETLHVLAVLPCEMKKLARRQVRRFFSEKRLKAPAYVRTLPGLQAITAGRGPVVAQRSKHFLVFLTYGRRLGFASSICHCLATALGRRKDGDVKSPLQQGNRR